MLLLLLACVSSRGLTPYSEHILYFVCTIRLCIVLGDGSIPGEVSTRTLGLEPDWFGGPLTRRFPAGG